MLDKLYNITQASKLLGVTTMSVYRWEKQGKIEFTKVNGLNKISESEIKKLRGEQLNEYNYDLALRFNVFVNAKTKEESQKILSDKIKNLVLRSDNLDSTLNGWSMELNKEEE